MADEILIDGERLGWAAFADRLVTLSAATTHAPDTSYARPPRNCSAEAARLIRVLDLGDCVTLLGEQPTVAARRSATLRESVAAMRVALRSLFGRMRRHPVHD